MNQKKEKILILVDWFTPGYKAGGPIRSSLNVAFSLKDNYRIDVITTDTDHGEKEPYKNISANCWTSTLDKDIRINYLKKRTLNFKQLKKEIIMVRPDYIYLNHIWSPYFVLYPLWLKFSGKVKSKVVICPRGGLYESALSVKWYKKKPLLTLMRLLNIQRHVVFHATNTREKAAIQKYFPGSNVIIADNLPSTNQPVFERIEKQKGHLKCIFIARIVTIKNLLYLINVLDKVKVRVRLTVIGPAEDLEYWKECKKKIDSLGDNITVDYVGPKNNDEITPILQHHHLFVLPTTGENFGHSIFEALLVGRPILISDQTPWLGLENKNIGWDIPLADSHKYVEAIEAAGRWSQQEFDEKALSAWNFARVFNESSEVKEKYIEIFS